jgi:hypothetical protein
VPFLGMLFTLDSQRPHYDGGDDVFVAYRPHGEEERVLFFYGVVSGHVCGGYYNVQLANKGGLDMAIHKSCMYGANWEELHTNCRRAVLTWLLCARRNRLVVKDVAKLIGELMWKTRNETDWRPQQ